MHNNYFFSLTNPPSVICLMESPMKYWLLQKGIPFMDYDVRPGILGNVNLLQ